VITPTRRRRPSGTRKIRVKGTRNIDERKSKVGLIYILDSGTLAEGKKLRADSKLFSVPVDCECETITKKQIERIKFTINLFMINCKAESGKKISIYNVIYKYSENVLTMMGPYFFASFTYNVSFIFFCSFMCKM